MTKQKGKKEPVYKSRIESFSKTYATNVLVEETDVDVRLYWFNEILSTSRGEKIALCEGSTILVDEAAVLLHEQLGKVLDAWKAKGKDVNVAKERRKLLSSIK
jgi:hypothetical protein